jgi:HSP20 family protein
LGSFHGADREGFSRGFSGFPIREVMPRMDVSETDKEIEVTAELPGLEEKDIQLNFADNLLTIRGEKKNEREEKEKDYHLIERSMVRSPYRPESARTTSRR